MRLFQATSGSEVTRSPDSTMKGDSIRRQPNLHAGGRFFRSMSGNGPLLTLREPSPEPGTRRRPTSNDLSCSDAESAKPLVERLAVVDSRKGSAIVRLSPALRSLINFGTVMGINQTQQQSSVVQEDLLFLRKFSPRADVNDSMIKLQDKVRRHTSGVNSERHSEDIHGIHALKAADQCARLNLLLLPDGPFLFYWLALVSLSVSYVWWSLMVREAFPTLQMNYWELWFALDIIVDIIYVCDIIMQFRTGYLEQGLVVSDARKLIQRYIRSPAFILDLFALCPLEYIGGLTPDHPILRATRLIKTHRGAQFYYMLESRAVYPNFIRVAGLTHVLLLACHWFACCQYMIARQSGFTTRWTYLNMESSTNGHPANSSITHRYLNSLYWSCLTLTTIGNDVIPETTPEFLFSIASYLIGVFVFATIVGQVGNVITNRNANRLEYERLLDGAKQYMRDHNIPQHMQRRVQRWYEYSWSRGRLAGGSSQSLTVLPDKLKTELALFVNLNTLKKVSIFNKCQAEFLQDLVLKMKAIIFTPGDYICRKGEIAREMYIIADGVVEILSDQNEIIRILKAGDFFGEIGILNLDSGMNKRTADVKSTGYSELFSLSKEDVLSAVKDYPEAEALLRQYGEKRLQQKRSRESSFQSSPVSSHVPFFTNHDATGCVNSPALHRTCPIKRSESDMPLGSPRFVPICSTHNHPAPVTNLLGVSITEITQPRINELKRETTNGPNTAQAMPHIHIEGIKSVERATTDLTDFVCPRLRQQFIDSLNTINEQTETEMHKLRNTITNKCALIAVLNNRVTLLGDQVDQLKNELSFLRSSTVDPSVVLDQSSKIDL